MPNQTHLDEISVSCINILWIEKRYYVVLLPYIYRYNDFLSQNIFASGSGNFFFLELTHSNILANVI